MYCTWQKRGGAHAPNTHRHNQRQGLKYSFIWLLYAWVTLYLCKRQDNERRPFTLVLRPIAWKNDYNAFIVKQGQLIGGMDEGVPFDVPINDQIWPGIGTKTRYESLCLLSCVRATILYLLLYCNYYVTIRPEAWLPLYPLAVPAFPCPSWV